MKRMSILFLFSIISIVGKSQQIPTWKITDVEKRIANSKDEILVFNFWATFCKPCVAEIPFFIKVSNKYKSNNVKLILVSLDLPNYYPNKIATFAKKHQFTADIVWLNETDADYFCPKIDLKWSGSIPATLMVNTKTGQRKFFEEEIEEADFEKALKSLF